MIRKGWTATTTRRTSSSTIGGQDSWLGFPLGPRRTPRSSPFEDRSIPRISRFPGSCLLFASSPRGIDGESARGEENRPARGTIAVALGDGAARRSVDRARCDDCGDEAILPPLHERSRSPSRRESAGARGPSRQEVPHRRPLSQAGTGPGNLSTNGISLTYGFRSNSGTSDGLTC
jgi:hypothetical protein